jgi:hypothetical protein
MTDNNDPVPLQPPALPVGSQMPFRRRLVRHQTGYLPVTAGTDYPGDVSWDNGPGSCLRRPKGTGVRLRRKRWRWR